MKTLEQTLEELKQLQEHININESNFKDSDWADVVKKLENAYSLASNELDKIEENSKQILKQQNEE
jgi:hypothetical protein